MPPQTMHLPSSAASPSLSIGFVSVISRVALHLTFDRHKPIDSSRCEERIVPGAEQGYAANPRALQNNESVKVLDHGVLSKKLELRPQTPKRREKSLTRGKETKI